MRSIRKHVTLPALLFELLASILCFMLIPDLSGFRLTVYFYPTLIITVCASALIVLFELNYRRKARIGERSNKIRYRLVQSVTLVLIIVLGIFIASMAWFSTKLMDTAASNTLMDGVLIGERGIYGQTGGLVVTGDGINVDEDLDMDLSGQNIDQVHFNVREAGNRSVTGVAGGISITGDNVKVGDGE